MAEKKYGHIFSVSELTRKLKNLLEDAFPFVWINGEISNLATPLSGHSYFTLKDDRAVIQSVMFKNQIRSLKFNLENGITILGLARMTIYEPRGNYQLIFEHIEPMGTGSLQLAFEQLKKKLAQKGYFDPEHKRPLPLLPEKISVITSASGAAVKDIIQTAQKRFPNCYLEIIPVKVQGETAVLQICQALETAQNISKPDVIILARGGGSLEDLAPFNSEALAESMYRCKIPIVTGIGHETDFTIADFIADLRAATPTAAAAAVFADRNELQKRIDHLKSRLTKSLEYKIASLKEKTGQLQKRLKSPQLFIFNSRMRVEEISNRLSLSLASKLQFYKQKSVWLNTSLMNRNPIHMISNAKIRINLLKHQLNQTIHKRIEFEKKRCENKVVALNALSPRHVLERGYSIARSIENKTVLTTVDQVQPDQKIEVILSKGLLVTKVEKKYGQKKNV